MPFKKLIILSPVFILLVACAGDPEVVKQRLLDTGNSYLESGKPREAALMYRRAIQTDRRFGEAYYRLGLVELELGRYQQAFRALHRAVELQPNNIDAFQKLADLYLASLSSDPRQSKQLLTDLRHITDRAEENQINPLLILRIRGLAALIEDRQDEAITLLRQARSIDPSDLRVSLALAGALNDVQQYKEAEKIALATIELDKSFNPMYDLLYLMYTGQGRDADAETLVLKRCEHNPKTITAWLHLAAHYHRTGQLEQRDQTLARITANSTDFPAAYMEVGDFYVRLQDFDKAIEQYKFGASNHPDQNTAFQVRIAQTLTANGMPAEALELAKQVLKEDPNNDQMRHLYGALRIEGGDTEAIQETITELESLIPRMPENPVLRFDLGRAHLVQGDTDEAIANFQEAARLRPNYVQPRIALGNLFLSMGQPAAVAELASEIIEVDGVNFEGWLLRAASLLGLREYHQAREAISKILEDHPGNPNARILMATLDFSERKYTEAEKLLRGLYEESPSDSRIMRGLVDVYVAEGRHDQARQILEKEIDQAPESVALRLLNASLSVHENNYDRAISEYERILETNPNDVEVHIRMGTTFYKSGDFKGAENHYRRARDLNPKNLVASMRLALLLGEMGRNAETTSLLEEILTRAPDNPFALNNLAYLLSESAENLDTALTLAQRAIEKAPNNANIADTLGWIYLKKNLSDDAVKVYSELVSKHPSHPTWRYHYAMALYQKGDRKQARSELEAALERNPSKDEEQSIRDLLSKVGS